VLYILDAIFVGFEDILLYVEQVDSVHGLTSSPWTEPCWFISRRSNL